MGRSGFPAPPPDMTRKLTQAQADDWQDSAYTRFQAWQRKSLAAAMHERCPYCGRALVTLPRCPGCGAPQ